MADIIGILGEVGRGYGLQEISAEFETVMDAVRQNGGSGELVIKLKIEGKAWHPHNNQLTEVGITHSISSKRPKRKVGASTFFVTRSGNLTRNNPDQAELFEDADSGVKKGK